MGTTILTTSRLINDSNLCMDQVTPILYPLPLPLHLPLYPQPHPVVQVVQVRLLLLLPRQWNPHHLELQSSRMAQWPVTTIHLLLVPHQLFKQPPWQHQPQLINQVQTTHLVTGQHPHLQQQPTGETPLLIGHTPTGIQWLRASLRKVETSRTNRHIMATRLSTASLPHNNTTMHSIAMLVGLDMGGVRPPTANRHGDGVDSSNTNRLSSTTGEVNNGVGLHSQEVELHSLGVRRGPAVDGHRCLHNIQTPKAVTMDKHTINSRTSISMMLIIRGIPKGTR